MQVNKHIAIIADWLIDFGGAELVISHLLELYPEADIYTSVCFMDHPMLEGRRVYTSWIQHIPYLSRKHKLAGILRPWAFRSFDLSGYDIIISSSSAESKNAGYRKRGKDTKHFCYCHTPTRYYWSHAEEYENMLEFGWLNPIVRWIFHLVKGWMRRVDFDAAQKVDFFIANSQNVHDRIEQYYFRDSVVIHPGVNPSEVQKDGLQNMRDPYYISVGRCIPYKRFDLLVETFNLNGKRLILCTATDNLLYRELQGKSKPNIEWRFRISNEEKNELLRGAKAFLFPPEEDFGLAPVEAMMNGTPVIAYGRGGALETVLNGETGIFFDKPSPESLNEAIEKFENMNWNKEYIQKHAIQFSKEKFQERISHYIHSYPLAYIISQS